MKVSFTKEEFDAIHRVAYTPEPTLDYDPFETEVPPDLRKKINFADEIESDDGTSYRMDLSDRERDHLADLLKKEKNQKWKQHADSAMRKLRPMNESNSPEQVIFDYIGIPADLFSTREKTLISMALVGLFQDRKRNADPWRDGDEHGDYSNSDLVKVQRVLAPLLGNFNRKTGKYDIGTTATRDDLRKAIHALEVDRDRYYRNVDSPGRKDFNDLIAKIKRLGESRMRNVFILK